MAGGKQPVCAREKEPPMTRRTESTVRNQGGSLEQLLMPLVDGALQTKVLLHEWMLAAGLTAVLELFNSEAAGLAGPKGRKQPGRTLNHWGTTSTELVLGGRKVTIPRPRVRGVAGGEVELPSVSRFRRIDPLTERVVNQMLLGVSTRRYERSLEPVVES